MAKYLKTRSLNYKINLGVSDVYTFLMEVLRSFDSNCLFFYISKDKETSVLVLKIGSFRWNSSYNQFHDILRLFNVLLNFPFITGEKMGHYYYL